LPLSLCSHCAESDHNAVSTIAEPPHRSETGNPCATAICQDILTDVTVLDLDQLPSDPLDALRELSRRESELGRLRREVIGSARAAGATWEEVGAALGMSRQAAWEYYSRATRARLEQLAADESDLSDDAAMELAVDEVKAARRERRRA